MTTRVTATPAADPAGALAHFESSFAFETDCWDVHESMAAGKPDFVLADVRSPAAYAQGHIAGAISLPHATIEKGTLAAATRGRSSGTVFVVYCAGPHCNGAQRAAIRLAKLGQPVKLMIGGITGWLDEGFTLEDGSAPPQSNTFA